MSRPPANEHTAIIVTIPRSFFNLYPGGEGRFREIMTAIDGDGVWCHSLSAIPRREVLHCYLAFSGMVRYRLTVAGYGRGDAPFLDVQPDGGAVVREHGGRCWVELCGPVAAADRDISCQGFRGFRYTPELF